MTDETEDPETLAIQFALEELRGRTGDIDGRVPAALYFELRVGGDHDVTPDE